MDSVSVNQDVLGHVDDIDWSSIGAPESVTVRSIEELVARLEKSEEDVAAGRTVPAEIVFEKMRRKYGFSS
jgi:hypothetical protein